MLARVERGEELTITVRGRPVADLIPTRERSDRAGVDWQRFATRLHGLLDEDASFATDVHAAVAGEAEDPFERWR